MHGEFKNMRWCIFALAIAICGQSVRADDPESTKAVPILYMKDGDFYSGALKESSATNVVRWQAAGALESFEFPIKLTRAMYFPPPSKRLPPAGEFSFELSEGDLVFGSLLSISPEVVEINSADFGHLHIARAEVLRIIPLSASTASEYRGPNGLAEWTQTEESEWHEEAGRIVTSKHGSGVIKEIAIPKQARIEFEVSWKKAPQFMLAFCSGDEKQQLDEGFRFEVWDRKVVLIRELKKDADVAVVGEIDKQTDRVHLTALYDSATGEFSVYGLNGKELAKVTMPGKDGKPLRNVWLMNNGVDLRLEQLDVSKWNGQAPPKIEAEKSRIHMADGKIVYGDIVSYQADTKQFVIHADDKDSTFDSSQVSCVVLNKENQSDSSASRVGLHDGSRCSGDLAKVDSENLYLQRRGVNEPILCATANVRSLVSLNRESPPDLTSKHRAGRLELEGVSSHGSLVEAAPAAPNSCLMWQPRGSATSANLSGEISGRIIYREPPVTPNAAAIIRQRQRPQPPGFVGAVTRVFTSAAGASGGTGNRSGTLCLLAGDRIPCESALVDDEGIHFKSSVVDSNTVPLAEVKAVELVPGWTAAGLAEEKRLRLLTLPRMQKANPPTHLIVSTNGDFLRGRLVSLTAETLTVETRLDKKAIPRERVACIIWLQDENTAEHAGDAAKLPPTEVLVQAVRSDGIRLTFVPSECKAGDVLVGTSALLGKCQVDLKAVDQLIIGNMIRSAAKELTYGAWKLSDAVEPQFAHEAAAGGGTDGAQKTESSLTSKPAPDFHLDLLDGKPFKLAEQKGHVVVLDFWASWCGPCMQAMPQVDEVMKEFTDKGVKLVAINMQEDRAAIKGALERLKIEPTVALDIDGGVAERYQVSAIPETVVIDAEGNVAEVFIGVNPGFAEQLRARIQALLSPNAKSQPGEAKKETP